ncbi:MAG: hypothetical protein CVU11_04885 [Bacteroidetes bacterium HGW-Bacteroidetes-6]|jgi:hypothetical protein|nr:MAG: hypothetical protein CVU11_04885 [Bacteroidetes bacterium HGW-Bacteroidetes-6]
MKWMKKIYIYRHPELVEGGQKSLLRSCFDRLSMTAFFVITSRLQNQFYLNYHERDKENRIVFHTRFTGLLTVSLILLFTSCEKETDWNLDNGKLPKIVVEAMLTNEDTTHEVVLSLPVSSLNETPAMVSGADVKIVFNSTTYNFTEDSQNPGHYYSDSTFHGIAGQTYSLLVQYVDQDSIGHLWYGSDVMPPAELFTPLSLALANTTDSIYKISYVASGYDPTRYAMYEIFLDWRHISGYDTISSVATLYFYTLGSLDMGEIVGNDFENIYFPKGTKIRERRYSISALYAAWIREILIETQWNNGIVVVQPGNAHSNLFDLTDSSYNAAGFFSTCGVSEWNGVAE